MNSPPLADFFRKHFFSRTFARNIMILMGGGMIAHVISFAVSPILTRIYSPSDFGIYALYFSVVSVIATLSTGRYDAAIMLPEKDEDALQTAVLSVYLVLGVSILSFFLIWIFNMALARALGNPSIGKWLYIAPLGVLLAGLYSSVGYLANRQGRYKRLSAGSIVSASVSSGTNVGMGLAGPGPSGLIWSSLIGQGVATGILGSGLKASLKNTSAFTSIGSLLKQARIHRKFPLFTLPGDFIFIAVQQVPIFLLNSFFGTTVVGLYALTQRVLLVPISLMGQSILGVFREQAVRDYNQYGNCREIFIKTLKSLAALTIVPFAVLFFAAPWLFALVFGETWRTAGEYAQLLVPLFFIRSVVSPLSYVITVAGKQLFYLLSQAVLFLVTVLAIMTGVYYGSPKVSIFCFSLSYSLFYLVYLLFSYRLASGKN